MNADGTGTTVINNTSGATYPYISPNGNRIVYTVTRHEAVPSSSIIAALSDIYTCNIDGSNLQRVIKSVPGSNHLYGTDSLYNGNWAKDNKRVLLISHQARLPNYLNLFNTDDKSSTGVSHSWVNIDAKIK